MTSFNTIIALAMALVAAAGLACASHGGSQLPPRFAEKGRVIVFTADAWCGYCRRLAPVLAELRDDTALDLTVYDEDDSEDNDYGDVLGVEGFPTIFVRGVQYDGPRTYEAIRAAALE
jgi:thiol-disulfide isomerase/thioredoxin